MSIRLGLLGAEASAPELLAVLTRLTGEFRREGEPVPFHLLPILDDGDNLAAIGEAGGRAYLHDESMFLSEDPDLIVAVSRELGGTVVGAAASSSYGSYTFVLAVRGELRRFHVNSYTMQDAPYDVGEPLPTEDDDPLEDIDGVGLFAAMRHVGFDPEAISTIELTPYDWVSSQTFEEGVHSAELAAFYKAHSTFDPTRAWSYRKFKIPREGGGYESAPPESRLPRGESGHTPRPQGLPPEPDTLKDRLWRFIGWG